jgi:predicted DNA-binding transcriptional regulator AlpA
MRPRSGGEASALTPPSKNKIGLPRSSLAARPGDRPSDFLLAPHHPVSPAGRGSCADFAQNPIIKQDAAAYTGYSEQQFSEFVKRGIAPKGVLFSRNARRFKRGDVDAWQDHTLFAVTP